MLWPSLILVAIVAALFLADRRFPEGVRRLEENVLAILLAIITLVSFSQVVARYGFNSGWGGALEFTRIAFAWITLFGMSYGLKQGIHLGVDALMRVFPSPVFKALAIFGAVCTLVYALMLLYVGLFGWLGLNVPSNWRQSGAIGYWTFMFERGTGLDDLRYPDLIRQLFGAPDRVQRWVAYLMLPVGLALLAFRALEGIIDIVRGRRELIIASHEAEDLVSENKNVAAG